MSNMHNSVTPEELMSVFAATVKEGDQVWYMNALRRVIRVENSTPLPGQITWTLDGVPEHPAVTVSATKKVFIQRLTRH